MRRNYYQTKKTKNEILGCNKNNDHPHQHPQKQIILREEEEDGFNCSICFDTSECENDVVKLSLCSHEFCKACIIQLLKSDAKGSRFPSKCPLCRTPLAKCDIEKVLSVNACNAYSYLEDFESAKKEMDGFFACKTTMCKNGVWIMDASKEKNWHCDKCRRQYCLRCKREAHNGTCHDYEMWKRRMGLGLLTLGGLFKEGKLKRCPSCRLYTHQTKKSYNIECENCRTSWCWWCMNKRADCGCAKRIKRRRRTVINQRMGMGQKRQFYLRNNNSNQFGTQFTRNEEFPNLMLPPPPPPIPSYANERFPSSFGESTFGYNQLPISTSVFNRSIQSDNERNGLPNNVIVSNIPFEQENSNSVSGDDNNLNENNDNVIDNSSPISSSTIQDFQTEMDNVESNSDNNIGENEISRPEEKVYFVDVRVVNERDSRRSRSSSRVVGERIVFDTPTPNQLRDMNSILGKRKRKRNENNLNEPKKKKRRTNEN